MFGRAMADRHGVGIIVSIDYHGASYDIQTPRLLCKHLTAAEVHPVPAGLTLAHRLGPDATPARRFAATAVDDGTLQRLFEAYKPDSDTRRTISSTGRRGTRSPRPPKRSTGGAWPTPWPRFPASRPCRRPPRSTTGPWM